MTEPESTAGRLRWEAVEVILRMIIVTGLVVTVGAVAWGATDAAAQSTPSNNSTLDDRAPYYNESTTGDVSPGLDVWLQGVGEPSLPNLIELALRGPSFWIGTGTGPGGGPAGILLTAIVVGGGVLAIVRGSRIGATAGAVIAILAVGLLAATGIIPTWLFAIALFVLGLVAAEVIARVLR